jgi:hypothetical protein
MIANDLAVPFAKIVLVSSISIKNVPLPNSNLSDAPIRVNILSTV